MLFDDEPVTQVNIPRSLVVSSPRPQSTYASRRRDREFVGRVRAIAAMRHAGCMVEPIVTDEQGARLSQEQELPLRGDVEKAVRELFSGREAHAKRTIEGLEAASKSEPEQVDDLLKRAYQRYAQGMPSTDLLDAFLDTYERWLTMEGIARVNLLFDSVDLDRAPESLGILLLATTRLTRAHFARRDSFVERLSHWLIGRAGRTAQDVDAMLRGLRE